MLAKRLGHICLGTADLPAAIRFYEQMFDWTVAFRFENDAGEMYGAWLSCGRGTFLELFNEVGVWPGASRFRHLGVEVEDIQLAARRAESLGHEPEVKRGRRDRVLQFFLQGPDGVEIEVQEHDSASVLAGYVV